MDGHVFMETEQTGPGGRARLHPSSSSSVTNLPSCAHMQQTKPDLELLISHKLPPSGAARDTHGQGFGTI